MIVNFIIVVPRTPWFCCQLRWISVTICSMYSGQQKFATSSWTPLPPPPPADRPKPWPRAPVSVRVTPGLRFVSVDASASAGGVRPRVWVGTTISGGLGGGGGIGLGHGFGRRRRLHRPAAHRVMPPVRGPGAPPRLIVITVRGALGLDTPVERSEQQHADEHDVRDERPRRASR